MKFTVKYRKYDPCPIIIMITIIITSDDSGKVLIVV